MSAHLILGKLAALSLAGSLASWTPSLAPATPAVSSAASSRSASPTVAALPTTVVVVYGDSLTVESEKAVQELYGGGVEKIVFRAYGGTAMCDWVAQAARDRVQLHPQRVVLAFTGNTASCVSRDFLRRGTAGAVANYDHALREMRSIYRAESITLVLAPAMHNGPRGWFPFNGCTALNDVYRRTGSELHMSINPAADESLTPRHVFSPTRPLAPDGPAVAVRLSDGVHLTDDGSSLYAKALLEIPASLT